MHTNTYELLPLHRAAVLASISVVDGVRLEDLTRPTPCAEWTLVDLLTHMTVQHRGFGFAARGFGGDQEIWRPETVLASVTADPAGTYAAAAHDVLDAFATDGAADVEFVLPDFGGVKVPGVMAMGFHFVDYVAHGWDVAATLGVPFVLPTDVVDAVLPLVRAVPDGDFRDQPGAPFARAVEPAGAGDLDDVLRHLGRRPEWNQAYSTVTGAWSDQRNA
ncbi:TIGR03086 family protein [Mycobacterium antarcticum]|uniref:TIGR03086 family metal-binding protein n=1 Tax=Mycolicibacterium sp. TUM20983 TaxID=3023369 RepID=UPI00239D3986|nr:TIGR03086 family metal-binding protein [Mycolicibacterium sp. TUM20983]GLP77174.1 TIGR03086 family protein [Mycolicibacterium sp. TUM20983]